MMLIACLIVNMLRRNLIEMQMKKTMLAGVMLITKHADGCFFDYTLMTPIFAECTWLRNQGVGHN